MELLQRDSRINWLQDQVDLWSNEVIRLTHHREDDERWLSKEKMAMRRIEREVRVHARVLCFTVFLLLIGGKYQRYITMH